MKSYDVLENASDRSQEENHQLLQQIGDARELQKNELIEKRCSGEEITKGELMRYLALKVGFEYQNVVTHPAWFSQQNVAPIQVRRGKEIAELNSETVNGVIINVYHQCLQELYSVVLNTESLEQREMSAKLFGQGKSVFENQRVPDGAKTYLSKMNASFSKRELSMLISCRHYLVEKDSSTPLPFLYDPLAQRHFAHEEFLKAVNDERNERLREIQVATGSPRNALGGDGLAWALESTASIVGQHFQAHGIGKGIPIELCDKIITKGIRVDQEFYQMPFQKVGEAIGAFGAESPITVGGIILVSKYGRFLEPGNQSIAYAVVGEEYCNVIDAMNERYKPHGVAVIPWHQAPFELWLDTVFNSGNDDPESWPVEPFPTYLTLQYRPKMAGYYNKQQAERVVMPPKSPEEKIESGKEIW
ncbi:MAG: hypothetical protein ACD_22C00088G0006 [uncultured bacterium]|nr:MAG: hypothetical protein ACD_22C00088G0006 [uncultured bacterium]